MDIESEGCVAKIADFFLSHRGVKGLIREKYPASLGRRSSPKKIAGSFNDVGDRQQPEFHQRLFTGSMQV